MKYLPSLELAFDPNLFAKVTNQKLLSKVYTREASDSRPKTDIGK